MNRVVFLDYVRVFACFLVMVVHASENFYGVSGASDIVYPGKRNVHEREDEK